MPNLVYILTNPAMPDLIKIGKTDNIERRMRELTSHSGVPEEFQCYYCAEVPDNKLLKKHCALLLLSKVLTPSVNFLKLIQIELKPL